MDIIVRLMGVIAIGLGVTAGIYMDQARVEAAAAGPSTWEAVLAVASVALLFAGAGFAFFGRALFGDRDPRR